MMCLGFWSLFKEKPCVLYKNMRQKNYGKSGQDALIYQVKWHIQSSLMDLEHSLTMDETDSSFLPPLRKLGLFSSLLLNEYSNVLESHTCNCFYKPLSHFAKSYYPWHKEQVAERCKIQMTV